MWDWGGGREEKLGLFLLCLSDPFAYIANIVLKSRVTVVVREERKHRGGDQRGGLESKMLEKREVGGRLRRASRRRRKVRWISGQGSN